MKIGIDHAVGFDQTDPLIHVHRWFLTVVLPDGKPNEEILAVVKQRLHSFADELTLESFAKRQRDPLEKKNCRPKRKRSF